ncbi:hypothetical protein QBC34DRAFT_467910 [Podospora aff. communis PSN243]|uniref:Heterokaryon incompatibility domain-containing protein n=1 Tax=Podospora aff. communis PSN243 TaxID=3040156 RepID=A0AAV9GIT8_9PEZI|nr:hypothetical protein QBC34DRAFT_467910 [Podospora aff. communis PSN243]
MQHDNSETAAAASGQSDATVVKTPTERAESLSNRARQFFDEFHSTWALECLDKAVQFASEALKALGEGHDTAAKYAYTLVCYAQTKANAVPGAESTEEFISALQAAVNAVAPEDPARSKLVQGLGCAYWARFEHSNADIDLDGAIAYIQGLADANHELLPQTKLIWGQAYYSRFMRTKATEDIGRSLQLINATLSSTGAELPLRHHFLEKLVQYSVEKIRHSKATGDLDGLIANARFAMTELPQSYTKERIGGILKQAEMGRELLAQRQMKAPEPIGKTFVPEVLYEKLPVGRKEIRVLELLPGDADADVVCKLHIGLVVGGVGYEALSWTWGNPDVVSDITIELDECKVTVNLALALRRLRRRDRSRMLWADAVLVWLGEPGLKDGSSDTPAKSSISPLPVADYQHPLIEWTMGEGHIRLMRQFFADEKTFFDWPVVGAISTLVLLALDCHVNTLPFFQDPRYPDFEVGYYPSELFQQSARALVRLLERPYWRRVWIVQEIVRGKSVLVHYGRHILPFDIFASAASCRWRHYYTCCSSHCGAADPNSKWSLLFAIMAELKNIGDLADMRLAWESQQPKELFDIFVAGIDFREATNQRDHVYGLLGLLSSDTRRDDLLHPDYGLSTAQVYTRAAFKIMRDSNSLRLLSYSDRQSYIEDLPSWCHDFGENALFNPKPFCWDLFSACSNTDNSNINIILSHDSSLTVQGYKLDSVTAVTKPRTPQGFPRIFFTQWFDDAYAFVRKHHLLLHADGTSQQQHEPEVALGSILLGGAFTRADGSTRRIGWAEQVIPPDTRDWVTHKTPDVLLEISSAVLASTQSRKLFATGERKLLGIGVSTVYGQEKEVQVGDAVWLLRGCNLPVVLRCVSRDSSNPTGEPSGDVAAASNRHYALVSTAYVDGIMNGEACPFAEDAFVDIAIGQYPESPGPSLDKETMKEALRMSLLLGHGMGRGDRHHVNSRKHEHSTSENDTGQGKGRDEKGEGQGGGLDAEAMLFPEGRKFDPSLKPIPRHRALFARLFEGMPDTEEGWEALEKRCRKRWRV